MSNINPVGVNGAGQLGIGNAGQKTQNRSVSDIILQLGLAALKNSHNEMNEFYDKIEKNNLDQKNIAEARRKLDEGSKVEDKFTYTQLDGTTVEMEIGAFIKSQGYGGSENPRSVDEAKARLKNASESIGSMNTMDMTKLQSSINKMNEMTQLVSNNLSKFNQMSMAIIGNLR